MSESITLEWVAIDVGNSRAIVDRRHDLERLFTARIWGKTCAWQVEVEHGDPPSIEREIIGAIREVHGIGDWKRSARLICTAIMAAWVHDFEEKEGILT